MEHFFPCELTAAGALKLFPGEVSLCIVAKVDISPVDGRDHGRQSGNFNVTTHRIVWIGDGVSLNASLRSLSMSATPVSCTSRRFPPLPRLILGYGNGVRVDFKNPRTARSDREQVSQQLSSALQRRQWEIRVLSTREAAEQATPAELAKRGAAGMAPLRESQMVGVGGNINEKKYAVETRGKQITLGFQSLESLMASADNLVQVAKRLRSLDASNDNDNELLNIMAELGIDSPVTKATSGNNTKLYRLELSRQLADYLPTPIIKSGGVMTATDAYCLVNKARATVELVSPDDFVFALKLFKHDSVNSRIEVCYLDDGVLALRLDVSSDADGAQALLEIAEKRTSISVLEVTRERKVPVQVALTMLETAEAQGMLCRDETTAGLRFFPNKFDLLVSAKSRH